MNNRKSTKRALLTSILSLLLCCSMLIGTTFAWFTDEVKSANNIITAGNLDVELEYAKVVNGQLSGWATVQGADAIFDPNALWEPGRVEVVYLKVTNLGTLDLKYQLGVNVYSEVAGKNVAGKEFKLSDYLVFKVVEMPNELTTYTDREAVKVASGTEMGLKDYNGVTTALPDGESDFVALIVYMPESVGNEANYRGTDIPKITLGVNLYATQKDAEQDSFGPDYDEDAWVDGMQVYNAQDLQTAINNGVSNIVLMADIDVAETIKVPEGATVSLNLNGKKLTNTTDIVIRNEGTLKLVGSGSVESSGQTSYAIRVQQGKVTIDSADINVKGAFGAVSIFNGADVTINGGNFSADGVAAKTSHTIYMGGYGTLNINGGSFYRAAGGDSGGVVVGYGWENEANEKAVININGGTFNSEASWGWISNYDGAWTTITATGGTFGRNPSAYVASGYKAVAVDGVYYVVADNVASVVTNPEDLKDALTNAGAAGAGNTTIAFFGNIDMSNTAWTPIKVDGYHGADIVTIEGNGATITGLTAPLFAGGFAGGSGIVIKDLTIANSNIVSTNTLGSGAFIESVDSMALITLENCHLVNSTVTGGSGSRTGGLIGWTAGYNNVNDGPVKTYVTITDCSVVGCTIRCDGSVGGIYGHAGNNAWTYSTIKDCTVKDCNLISTDDGGWRVGVVVGTANVGEVTISNITESGNTLTQTGKSAPVGQSNLYGRFVPGSTGTLVIDGAYILPAATQEALNDAISDGKTEISLPAGNYTLPSAVAGKEVTISGTKDTVIDVTSSINMNSGDLVFDGVTVLSNGGGFNNGIQHVDTIVYQNATIVGSRSLYGNKEVFINCTFDLTGISDYIWVYGANEAEFINCTFNTAGKAILIYNEGDGACKVTVKGCTFNATTGAKAGAIANQNCAAIEIDNHQNSGTGAAHILITEGNTYNSNFSGEWRIKNFVSGNAVTVNGKEYTQIAIDGKLMTIDASKNVTVL